MRIARKLGRLKAGFAKAVPPAADLPQPRYFEMTAAVRRVTFPVTLGAPEYYARPMIGAPALGATFARRSQDSVRAARALLQRLSSDDYLRYLVGYYEAGLEKFGEDWGYLDIVTVLLGLTKELAPEAYLEIGVRRGRSACAVGSVAPDCAMLLFDMWIENYAGMANPGPALVQAELRAVGHYGPVEFVDGDSHLTLSRYFSDHPDAAFDLITVDGDHTDRGAAQDLAEVLPRLKIGGAVVFDDVAHPLHPGLREVWRHMVEEDRRFSTYSFEGAGYGVAFALRKY